MFNSNWTDSMWSCIINIEFGSPHCCIWYVGVGGEVAGQSRVLPYWFNWNNFGTTFCASLDNTHSNCWMQIATRSGRSSYPPYHFTLPRRQVAVGSSWFVKLNVIRPLRDVCVDGTKNQSPNDMHGRMAGGRSMHRTVVCVNGGGIKYCFWHG